MCLVWKYGEYNKSYERGSRKCHLEVLSIFIFGIVRLRVGRIAADFYPQPLKNRFLQPVCLLRIVTQLVEMLACLLPCSGVTDIWPLSRRFYAGPAKWRENNGAKMTSWSRKKFPVRVSETKRVKITLSLLQDLDCCRFEPKKRFWSDFQFLGTRNKWMYYSMWCVCACAHARVTMKRKCQTNGKNDKWYTCKEKHKNSKKPSHQLITAILTEEQEKQASEPTQVTVYPLRDLNQMCVCVCVCVCVCACVRACVCVCLSVCEQVSERQTDRQRQIDGE